MMRLSSYVMAEYDDRLSEVERYKVKFKENKQLVNNAKKTSKALVDAIRLKDENFESLKRQNGLKRSIPTERDVAVQEFLDNGSIIRKYRDEMDEYRQKGEAFVLAVDPSNDDNSDNEASISEQSQESEDGPGDAEEGGDDDKVET
ncbi:unnamed protein product [Malus baccata var. baccata]